MCIRIGLDKIVIFQQCLEVNCYTKSISITNPNRNCVASNSHADSITYWIGVTHTESANVERVRLI